MPLVVLQQIEAVPADSARAPEDLVLPHYPRHVLLRPLVLAPASARALRELRVLPVVVAKVVVLRPPLRVWIRAVGIPLERPAALHGDREGADLDAHRVAGRRLEADVHAAGAVARAGGRRRVLLVLGHLADWVAQRTLVRSAQIAQVAQRLGARLEGVVHVQRAEGAPLGVIVVARGLEDPCVPRRGSDVVHGVRRGAV
mmetsp:Transcript_47018/g.156687  ORF Transcript_47018/g.156687 Transcript_47018/m.156687 type:complete len:200 (-) Transcript_47018:512-1111(-)